MIVGTAGHIDHGKTTLVRALTGVDTDRLPEEKRRGISIELGYAFLDTPDGARMGVIDVPGHERLVHTMLAGATGIDHALLLVAADDGVMPQTREHAAIMTLLEIGSASVVITKTDRADAARLEAVRMQIRELASGTVLADAPVFEVSAQEGLGIDALRTHLFDLRARWVTRTAIGQGFRLAIDRVFVVEGAGTVVTGTVHAGGVAVGDELVVAPSSGRLLQARVRSLHAQNRSVSSAGPGQRCALGLVGIGREQLRRGQWLVSPDIALSTSRIDVSLRLLPSEARALRSGVPVHVHVGAASVTGSVALLEGGDSLAPGARGRAQLVLHEPIAAWRGDRVVIRDASASRTLGGGTVLDPFAPSRYRRTPQRLAELEACALVDAHARRRSLIAAAPFGVDISRWLQAEGAHALEPNPVSWPAAAGDDDPLWAREGVRWLALGRGHARVLSGQLLDRLGHYHEAQPDELGPDAARLCRWVAPRLPQALGQAILRSLQASGQICLRGSFVHRPEHLARLSAVETRIAQKLAPLLADAGFEGAWARDLARQTQEPEPLLRVTLVRLSQRAEVHQVVRDLIYDVGSIRALARIVRELAAARDGQVTAALFRDATGLGRKRAIQILEYFDRIGMLRRVGDEHRLRTDTALFVEDAVVQA